MDRPCKSYFLAAFVLCGVLAAVPAAAQPNIVTLRLESLDALTAEAGKLGDSVSMPLDRDSLMKDLPLGLPGGDWLDGERPIVAVLPQLGMMAGDQGFVAALPVRDLSMLMEALEARYSEHAEEVETHTFSGAGLPAVYVRPLGGYVAVGAMKNFVDAFDLDSALALDDLPEGVIAVEILLEPIAPLVQMTLMQGREAMKQQIAGDAGDGSGSGEVDAAALTGMMDVYFDLLNDMMNNVSSVQIAAGVEGENLLLRKRLLPRAGSTLAGMLANQSGGLPKIARYVDPADSAWTVAGQVKYTPAFREALGGYIERYGAAIGELTSAFDSMPEMSGFGGWFSSLAQSSTRMLDCYRGDFVGVTHFGDSGMDSMNLAGVVDAQSCSSALETMTLALAEVEAMPAAGMEIDANPKAFDHRGVVAMEQTIRFKPSGDAAQDEIIAAVYGDSGLSTYTGIHENVMVSVTGGESAQRNFRGLVDTVADAKKDKGIPASYFSPLEVTSGFYGRFDIGAFFDTFASIAGVQADAAGNGEAGAATIDGAMVVGASFTPKALDIELAFPHAVWTGR